MKLKDLKVGDVIYIREDVNNPDKKWANKYDKPRLTGLQLIFKVDYKNGYFNILGELDSAFIERHTYTVEMIDWEKTKRLNNIKNSNRIENINTTDLAKEYLNSKFGYLNINKDVVNENIFKKITQSGESGNETTKAITYDGREIIVKNNNEENDVEKAVMLLMLKQRGVIYEDIKREVEKVKIKWVPKRDEKYYWINKYLEIDWYVWEAHGVDKMLFRRDNCFETRKEAEEKIEKIKEILKGE